jgi:hypothetical protein
MEVMQKAQEIHYTKSKRKEEELNRNIKDLIKN